TVLAWPLLKPWRLESSLTVSGLPVGSVLLIVGLLNRMSSGTAPSTPDHHPKYGLLFQVAARGCERVTGHPKIGGIDANYRSIWWTLSDGRNRARTRC